MGRQRHDPRKANGARRRKAVAIVRARHEACHLCGQPIDYDLPWYDPMAFSADELVPVSLGGSPYDPSNIKAAHRICNMKRQNKTLGELGDKRSPFKPVNGATLPQSREW